MEMNVIQPTVTVSQPSAPAAAEAPKAPTLKPRQMSLQAINRAAEQQPQVRTNPDDQRKAAVTRAAHVFKDYYPVRDVTFTIFKDSSGQYITRFTNLRDGKVTYIPEQDILAFLNRMGQQAISVEINA